MIQLLWALAKLQVRLRVQCSLAGMTLRLEILRQLCWGRSHCH